MQPHARADLEAVNAVARLQLWAKRAGRNVRLDSLPPDLVALIEWVGLAEAFGQAERVEDRGVEEVVVADDPIA